MIWIALKKIGIISLLVLAVSAAGRIWYVAKDGFNVNRIYYSLPEGSGEDESKEKEAGSLLSSPYRYIGRGRQCYIFASEDNRTVIKIPRFDRYALSLFWRSTPSSFDSIKQSIRDGRQSRLRFMMNSFQIAAQDLAKETSVIYLHQHRSRHLPERLIILDRFNRSYELNPNHIVFVLQEKKDLMMPLVLKALSDGNRIGAEEMISAYLDVIEARARKGIFNRDPSFLKNFGWDGSKSVQIDIGSFWRKPGLSADDAYGISLREGSERIQEWLAETDGGMLDYYNRQLEARLKRG